MLPATSKAMKYILFIFNFVFVLTGISLITMGVIIKSQTEKFEPVLDEDFVSAPTLLIFLGIFVFIVAFFGCCGSLRENQCMILTFSVIMAAIFIAEITVGVTGYMLKAESADVLEKTMHDSMYKYNNESDYHRFWDELQGDLECCGTKNYTDWIEIYKNESLPMTCCTSVLGTKGVKTCNAASEVLHKKSCFNALEILVQENASSLGFTGIAIAVVQLLGIIFSCKLAYSIRSSYESV